MFHRIKVENEIFLPNDDTYFLEISEYHVINIIVEKERTVKLVMIGTSNYDLNITLLDKASLTINSINKDNSVNTNIKLMENSKILYHHNVVSQNDSLNKFHIMHQGNNSGSILNNNGINKDNKRLFFEIDGVIPKDLKEIFCQENSKIINIKDGNSKIMPNLIVDSDDIVASHSAYIGKIDDEEMFYLASRGLTQESIEKLVYKGMMLGKMVLDFEEEEFNKIINEWW